jgi:hypothetical protein
VSSSSHQIAKVVFFEEEFVRNFFTIITKPGLDLCHNNLLLQFLPFYDKTKKEGDKLSK